MSYKPEVGSISIWWGIIVPSSRSIVSCGHTTVRSPFLSGSFEGTLISSSDESVSGSVPAMITLLRFFLGGDRLVSSSEEDDSSIRLFRLGFFMVGLYDEEDEELESAAEESAAEECCLFPFKEDCFFPLLVPKAAAARGTLIDFFPPIVDSF